MIEARKAWKLFCFFLTNCIQKQPPRSVLRKRCSENIQQIYRRTLRHECPPVNFCKFSEHFLPRTHLRGCFCAYANFQKIRVNLAHYVPALPSYRNQSIDLLALNGVRKPELSDLVKIYLFVFFGQKSYRSVTYSFYVILFTMNNYIILFHRIYDMRIFIS